MFLKSQCITHYCFAHISFVRTMHSLADIEGTTFANAVFFSTAAIAAGRVTRKYEMTSRPLTALNKVAAACASFVRSVCCVFGVRIACETVGNRGVSAGDAEGRARECARGLEKSRCGRTVTCVLVCGARGNAGGGR